MNCTAERPAGLVRRLGASAYEALLLGAILILVGFVLLPLVTPPAGPGSAPSSLGTPRPIYLLSPGARHLSAGVSFAVCGLYCCTLWSRGRRTLAMKAWRLALCTGARTPVGLPTAIVRYLAWWVGPTLAIASYLAVQPLGYGRWALWGLAFNYAWALLDRDGQFFQDRIAGTRLVLGPGATRLRRG
ncbi:MAG TPA: RDD family protein [Casimicrobiaceae bacterium]